MTSGMNLDRRWDFSKLCLPGVLGSQLSFVRALPAHSGQCGRRDAIADVDFRKDGWKLGVKMTAYLGFVSAACLRDSASPCRTANWPCACP